MKAPLYHICSDENHPDFFFNDSDFKAAINILAMSIALFEDIELYAFVLMSNHIHLLVGGPKDIVDAFFKLYVKSLSKYFRAERKADLISDLKAGFHLVADCEHLLNVIVYIHRNPCVIDRSSSPYSYRWEVADTTSIPRPCKDTIPSGGISRYVNVNNILTAENLMGRIIIRNG